MALLALIDQAVAAELRAIQKVQRNVAFGGQNLGAAGLVIE